ncbi:hypothetical protein PF001_g6645 [Phytophthora fragariae]|uniref:Uncharacterized protein n=1 Tax=Phytophthora fragariae TaxID=53985 RepID=A0A6A3F8A0_9STRA|nr:hypothetical protein PF003_g18214 [Phytophthora fragariae]KAE8942065.1 hypothetical protein PF009_g8157 [Phytophthora fragariae]KAE9149144.1 hypothetical protein PF006_g6337 [Phytophthora fragariae]KAE9237021.1 hypothetical protein PF004_g8685 [Phytophthora fragariae]KAE9317865.1 hypothetical protein PF001_g6645 [Phytophthora fragariae]
MDATGASAITNPRAEVARDARSRTGAAGMGRVTSPPATAAVLVVEHCHFNADGAGAC